MLGRRLQARVAALALASALAACSLVVDLSSLTGGDASVSDASADVSAVDASAPDVWDDAADAAIMMNACGAPLFGEQIPIADPGFETGCGGWTTYESTYV